MFTVLRPLIFLPVLMLSSNAAPYKANNWEKWRGGWHNGNASAREYLHFASGIAQIPDLNFLINALSEIGCTDSSGGPSIPTSFPSISVVSPAGPSGTLPSVSPSSSASTDGVVPVSTDSAEQAGTLQSSVTPSSTATTIASASASSPTTSDSDKQAWLDGHNTLRQQHGAANLTWSDTLASTAQSWANGCVFQHSGGQYGENLFAGAGGTWLVSSATESWASEEDDYDSSSPVASHFTQMVWKATTELGCANALCDGIFDPSFGQATYYVCEYNPAGNVIGAFDANVQV